MRAILDGVVVARNDCDFVMLPIGMCMDGAVRAG